MDRSGCRRLLALIDGLPPDSAVRRGDQPTWTQQDELLTTIAEVVDLWSRYIMFAVMRGPVKSPQVPPSFVDIRHPERKRPEPEPAPPPALSWRRPGDEHVRAPARMNPAAVAQLRRASH